MDVLIIAKLNLAGHAVASRGTINVIAQKPAVMAIIITTGIFGLTLTVPITWVIDAMMAIISTTMVAMNIAMWKDLTFHSLKLIGFAHTIL